MTQPSLDKSLWPGILRYNPKSPGTPVEPATDVNMGVPVQISSIHDTPRLLASVIKMSTAMHKESPVYKHIPYSQKAIMQLYYQMCMNPKMHVCLIAHKDDHVIGMIGGYIVPFFFSEDRVAIDLFLYVDKEHRGGTAAPRLVKAFEQWAKKTGAIRVVLGATTGVDTERTLAMYRKFDYEDIGALVKKDLDDG